MCKKLIHLISFIFVLFLVSSASVASAATVTYWRFDDVGDPVIDVPPGTVAPGNPLPDSDSWAVWRKAAHDHSGNGNHLMTWEYPGAGHVWSSDVPASTIPLTGASNALSIVNSGNWPAAQTWSSRSSPSGTNIQSLTPVAFTIEISFKLNQLPTPGDTYLSHLTLIGRDGTGLVTNDSGLAPLNLGIWPGNTLIIRFADMAGYNHVAETAPGTITTDQWYNVVAVSDGLTLSLYLDNALVAQTDLAASGSTDTAMASGIGSSGGGWEGGNWSISRGHRNGEHTDRVFGYIDEVRITDTALSPSEYLFVPLSIYNPYPKKGATDVQRDVVLSWTPGIYAQTHDVYFGTVFDDVNNADRNNPLSVLLSEKQDAETYDIGRLDFGQTYYWRVDEVSAPPDLTIFKGEVFSFTIEPFAIPIPGESITTTAATQVPGQGPEKTIDGSGLVGDFHSMELTGMWFSEAGEPGSAWIQYDFDKAYKLHEMLVWNYNGQTINSRYGFKHVTVEYSTDGAIWTQLDNVSEFAQASGAEDYTHNTTVAFNGIAARHVKMTANSNWGGGGFFNQYGLSEVRFFYIPVHASEPSPDNGATGVALEPTLGWRAGREAAEHNVYFSDDEQTVIDGTADVTTLTDNSYDPLSLDLGKTYYWRLDEVNNAETPSTWQGEVWEFTTFEYFVIDDMEDYNDYPPDRIFDTWIDGWDDPTNGSTSGYPDPIFGIGEHYMETTIVHGGAQSMPVFYDNSVGNSEATMTLSSLNDWTQKGIGSLVIWYIGNAANAAEPMYVVLNGSAVVTHDNPDAAQIGEWTQWIIDLQAFADQGVNLTNVNTIAIGLGNKKNPAAGGSGTIYIDDIRLYRPAP